MKEEKNILINVHNSYRNVVAICDKELLGKMFVEENKQLDLTGKFFEGKESTEKETIEEIKKLEAEDATFNIIGKKAIETAIKTKIITKKGIMTIKNIPYALVLL